MNQLLLCMLFSGLVLADLHTFYTPPNDTLSNKHYESAGAGTATSGRKHTLHKIRQFNKRLSKYASDARIASYTTSITCNVWAVATTIFKPSNALQAFLNKSSICLCIVLDKKAKLPFDLYSNNSVVLTPDIQEGLPFRSISLIPWNHFGRKNIGYLYAFAGGAQHIFDFDDDNFISEVEFTKAFDFVKKTSKVRSYDCNHNLLNPYTMFGADAWPRGYPLDHVLATNKNICNATDIDVQPMMVAIIQSLADVDPDVDAIYRLTRRLPVLFSRDGAVSPAVGTFSPYNAQATIINRNAFFSILLPISVHGRISDIWRSYFVKKVLDDVSLKVLYTAPFVDQYRNAHDFLRDFDSEIDLYLKSGSLIKVLKDYENVGTNAAEMLFNIFVHMYEHGVIEEIDVLLYHAFMQDMIDLHIEFPTTNLQTNMPRSVAGKSKKIAVCMSGGLNAGAYGPAVFDSMLRKHFNDSFDLFAVVPLTNNDPEAIKYIQPKTVMLSKSTSLWIHDSLIEARYQKCDNRKCWLTFNYQINDWKMCMDAIENEASSTQNNYSWIIRVRPDIFLPEGMPQISELRTDAISIPDDHHFGGIQDRFAIGPYKLMKEYLSLENGIPFIMNKTSQHRNANIELLLKHHLDAKSIQVDRRKDISSCTASIRDRKMYMRYVSSKTCNVPHFLSQLKERSVSSW